MPVLWLSWRYKGTGLVLQEVSAVSNNCGVVLVNGWEFIPCQRLCLYRGEQRTQTFATRPVHLRASVLSILFLLLRQWPLSCPSCSHALILSSCAAAFSSASLPEMRGHCFLPRRCRESSRQQWLPWRLKYTPTSPPYLYFFSLLINY